MIKIIFKPNIELQWFDGEYAKDLDDLTIGYEYMASFPLIFLKEIGGKKLKDFDRKEIIADVKRHVTAWGRNRLLKDVHDITLIDDVRFMYKSELGVLCFTFRTLCSKCQYINFNAPIYLNAQKVEKIIETDKILFKGK